jgi:hypothetical protein
MSISKENAMMITAALVLMISAAASAETAPLPLPRLCVGAAGSDLMAGSCIDEDGSPSSHTHLFLSYNGEFVPDDVRSSFPYERLITGSDGTTILTHMPAGEYGFWTMETPEEHVAGNPRYLGAVTPASVLPGENNVTLVAKPRAKAGK